MKNTIYGLAVLALSSGEPVGKFAVPQESSGTHLSSHQGCQPGHCVEPDVRKIGRPCMLILHVQRYTNIP